MDDGEIQKIIKETPALLTFSEAKTLFNLAKSITAQGVFVEIGSYKGGSTILLANASLAGPGVKVYAIDPHVHATKEIFMKNISEAKIGGWVQPVYQESLIAFKNWQLPISLLFIDGSHRYKDVVFDIYHWEQFLTIGGLIIFHDAAYIKKPWYFLSKDKTRRPGVERAVKELFLTGRFIKEGTIDTLVFAKKIKSGEPLPVDWLHPYLTYVFKKEFWLTVKYIFITNLIIKIDFCIGQIGKALKFFSPRTYWFCKKIIIKVRFVVK